MTIADGVNYKVLAGDVDPAIRTHAAFFSVWKKYGFTPEGFNLATMSVQVIDFVDFLPVKACLVNLLSLKFQHGQKSYPLRPELIESTYWLFKATRDPRYVLQLYGKFLIHYFG